MTNPIEYKTSEIIETEKLTHKAQLVKQILGKIPETIRKEFEKYVKIEPIVKIICKHPETGEWEDITDFYEEYRTYYGKLECKHYVVGERVIGKIPFEFLQKHNFLINYIDKELVHKLFHEGLVELPHDIRVNVEHFGVAGKDKVIYEDDETVVVESTFYDSIFPSYYIYRKIYVPQIELTLYKLEKQYIEYGWKKFKEAEPELAKKIEEYEKRKELERDLKYWNEYIESLKVGKFDQHPSCALIRQFFENTDEEVKKLVIRNCETWIRSKINELVDKLGEAQKNYETVGLIAGRHIKESCTKCVVYQFIKSVVEDALKVVETAEKWNENIYKIEDELREKRNKLIESLYNEIKNELSKLPVQIVNEYKITGLEFYIEVKVGNGKWLKREEFNKVISKLKELKFRFDSKNKTWFIKVEGEVDVKNRKVVLKYGKVKHRTVSIIISQEYLCLIWKKNKIFLAKDIARSAR